MRLIAIGEHFQSSALAEVARPAGFDRALGARNPMAERLAKLDDLGCARLADMDAVGIDLQVLSQTVGSMPEPSAAVELAQGALVNGTQSGRFLDDRSFWPVFETAEQLGVPIYLHPAEPPEAIRAAYYGGLVPATAQTLATAGWGWHVEKGLHALRLIVSGLFDEENFYATASGMFAYPPLLCLLLVVGADRVVFSVDYPYCTNEEARTFIDGAPISPADKEKIAHGNAARLLGL